MRTTPHFNYPNAQKMTQEAIRQQIEAIRKASHDAGKSPETSRQFLIDAGIIKEPEKKEVQQLVKKKK